MRKADVIKYFGGGTKVAIALGINKSTVSCWGKIIPEGRAYQVEVLTGGQLKVNHADYVAPANPTAARKAHS